MSVIEPRPTRRAGIDTGWKCNVKCKFCYHIFKDTDREPDPLEKVRLALDQAKARGNDTVDFVGPGEPSIVPTIGAAIAYAKSIGLRTCMITHGMIGATRLAEIIDAGLDDFLISMHGLEATHNEILGQVKGARRGQEKTIAELHRRGRTYRVNYVLNTQNWSEVAEFSRYLLTLPLLPRIINFINFNPHDEWSGNVKSKEFIADLRLLEPVLDEAIDLLEAAGIGVNVRYYPMCRIAERHRKNICNDLHVMLDPYEWDYKVLPKTAEHYTAYGEYISRTIEKKDGACGACDIRGICGGINKQFDAMSDGQQIDAVIAPALRGAPAYHYRGQNLPVHVWDEVAVEA